MGSLSGRCLTTVWNTATTSTQRATESAYHAHMPKLQRDGRLKDFPCGVDLPFPSTHWVTDVQKLLGRNSAYLASIRVHGGRWLKADPNDRSIVERKDD